MTSLAVPALIQALLALALTLPAIGETAAAQPPPEEYVGFSTLQQETALDAETALHVSNRYGDVRARGSATETLRVIAAVQRFEAEQPEPRIQIQEEEGARHLVVHFPSADPVQPGDPLQGRVDITVLVPPGRTLHLETDTGLIEAKGVQRDLFARSRGGRLEVITSRPLDTRADQGETQLLLRRSFRERPHRIRSQSGDIQVNVPSSETLSLRAHTKSGEMTNQLSPSFEPVIDENGALHVGPAPFAIDVESTSGNIELHSR